jgi:hypothetical protein
MAGFLVAPGGQLLIEANVAADPATELIYKRRNKKLYPYVTASTFNKVQRSLISAQDRRAGVRTALLAFDSGYVTASGHGRYVDNDWNDAVVQFSWWVPPTLRDPQDLHISAQ